MEKTFEQRMGDDLDVKGAFDGLRKNLIRLMSLKEKGAFTGGDARKLRGVLERVDRVFQVLGSQ